MSFLIRIDGDLSEERVQIAIRKSVRQIGMDVPKESIGRFVGLRGFISILIVYGHFILFIPFERDLDSYRFCLVEVYQCVTLLFAMSGMSHVKSSSDPMSLSSWRGARQFLLKRVARLAPSYFFSLLLMLPIYVVTFKGSLWDMFTDLAYVVSMTQSLLNPVRTSMVHPGLWQISGLALCYLMYPVVSQRLNKLDTKSISVFFLASWLLPIAFWIGFTIFVSEDRAGNYIHMSFIIRAPHFFSGVLAMLLIERPEISRRLARLPWDVLADLGTCFFAGTQMFLWYVVYIDLSYWVPYRRFCQFVFLPVHVLWLFSLLKSDRSWTSWFLSWGLFRELGEVSYSTLCTHLPLFYWMILIICGPVPVKISFFGAKGVFCLPLWYFIWMVPVCVVIGYISHYYIDKPSRQWILDLSSFRS